jgi:hypothetical protein
MVPLQVLSKGAVSTQKTATLFALNANALPTIANTITEVTIILNFFMLKILVYKKNTYLCITHQRVSRLKHVDEFVMTIAYLNRLRS